MLTSAPTSERVTPLGGAEGSAGPAPSAQGLRVAIVSDAAPERNGVGTYYRDLAEHLKAAGAKVELISPRFRAGNWYGGLALPMPGDPTQKFLFPTPWLIGRRLERLSPNAMIVPTPGPFGMLGMLYARRHKTRLVVGFHTHFERLAAQNKEWRVFGVTAQTYLNACHRSLFRAGSLVLVNSGEMLDVAREIGADKVGLMGTSIPKRFLDRPVRPIEGSIRQVLFAGRLAPEKNLGAVFEAAGHRLAGHGFCHAIERFGGLGHRLHGLFLSRRVAEHLALDADGISHLMQRCYNWFGDNGLAAPTLYVPPAWALGRISIERLAADCPFACIERFDGMLVPRQRRAYRLPLLGYEADTPLRAPVLWLWNVLNRRAARRRGRALRIGIHPRDPALALGKALIRDLHRPWRTLDTDQWLAEASTPR